MIRPARPTLAEVPLADLSFRLNVIDAENRVEVNALYWAHLAKLILEDRQTIAQVVRYEDLTIDPELTMRSLLQRIPGSIAFVPMKPFEPSVARSNRRASLTKDDIIAIGRECREAAETFGYDLDVNVALPNGLA